ncbi:MAG: AIM24 family protein [Deltaproteobacteria bacterium]|nr:AIM24 family protein [Deltaproteobacteria bacterium]
MDERLIVSTGNLAAFANSVDYDIQTLEIVGQTLFGGEGIFMTRLTGRGVVLLQRLMRGAASIGNIAAVGWMTLNNS